MEKVGLKCALAAAGLLAAGPAIAARSNCPPNSSCGTQTGSAGGVSVEPTPDEFAARGDIFTNQFTEVTTNASTPIDLGFNVNFGAGAVGSTLYVGKNGIVSFGAPLPGVAAPVSNLYELGVPVIAPFYANLSTNGASDNGRLEFGDITVQYGLADPYADGGAYSQRDARSAVRITWYGLSTGFGAVAAPNNVFAQLLISSDVDGLSNFAFRYGPVDQPGQAGYNSIAGFALGGTQVQFGGPYNGDSPTFFEFNDGNYIGQGGAPIPGVPEPATWAELVAGFGLLGLAARRRGKVGPAVVA